MHETVARFHRTDVPDPLSASWVGAHMAGVCLPLDHRALWFQTLPDNNTVFSGDAVTQVSIVPCHSYAACARVGTPWVKTSGGEPASERVFLECEWISTLHTSSSARKLKRTFEAK